LSKISANQSKLFPALMPGIIDELYMSQIKESRFFSRKEGTLRELSASIQRNGLLQPILVRPKDNHYEIVGGNRRFQACRGLKWKKIACHIIELEDKDAFEISIVENIHRKTLNPLEEATAFKAYVSDFGWGGVSDLAFKIGKSTSYVTKRIKLLNLPSGILDSILNRKMDTSIAEELLSVKNRDKQSRLAILISDRRLSMRMTRRLLKEMERSDSDIESIINKSEKIDHIRLTERVFDQSIAVVKIAMNNLREIISSVEHDWIIYEILMQHRNRLHTQIDILFKEKKKLSTTRSHALKK
jgi:ParB family transcriptional regulator, chromosome partitioning protein